LALLIKTLTPVVQVAIVSHMVNDNVLEMDKVFSALSDPTRRIILDRLRQGQASITQIYRYRLSPNTLKSFKMRGWSATSNKGALTIYTSTHYR
jgi:hypothetical protein